MGCLKTELQHAEFVAAGGLKRLSAMLEEIKRQRVLDQGAEAPPEKVVDRQALQEMPNEAKAREQEVHRLMSTIASARAACVSPAHRRIRSRPPTIQQ